MGEDPEGITGNSRLDVYAPVLFSKGVSVALPKESTLLGKPGIGKFLIEFVNTTRRIHELHLAREKWV